MLELGIIATHTKTPCFNFQSKLNHGYARIKVSHHALTIYIYIYIFLNFKQDHKPGFLSYA